MKIFKFISKCERVFVVVFHARTDPGQETEIKTHVTYKYTDILEILLERAKVLYIITFTWRPFLLFSDYGFWIHVDSVLLPLSTNKCIFKNYFQMEM